MGRVCHCDRGVAEGDGRMKSTIQPKEETAWKTSRLIGWFASEQIRRYLGRNRA